MNKKKVVKLGNMYYASVYSDKGILLDSMAYSSKKRAEKALKSKSLII